MDLKLSTFNFRFCLTAGLLFFAGCAQKQIRPISESMTPREQSIAYETGPEKPSSAIFVDMAEAYGLKGVKAVHLYAVDVNHDGATDLITLEDFYAAPKFYYFDKSQKKFKQGDNPFGEIIRASYLNFVDLDHDGVYDVIVGSLNQKSEMTKYPTRIYKGSIAKGTLTYSLKTTLLTGPLPTASVQALDFNLDGELDLYLANWFSQDDNPKPLTDILMMGKEFVFTDSSSILAGEYDYEKHTKQYTNATPTFGASVCDVDQNGFPDVLTSNSNGYFNKMWLNIDGKSFVNYGVESGYAADDEGSADSKGGGNSFFSLCGDYNNDQLVDIVVGNLAKESDQEFRDKSTILTGRSKTFPPKFYRTDFFNNDEKPNWSEGNRRGVWIDYNLDGLNDLIIANSGFPPDSRLIFLEQQKDHAYDDKSALFGVNLMNPSGIVTLDINGDGVMDFISGQSKVRAGDIDTRVYLFVNQTKRSGRGSVRFHLQGKRSNTHGISSWMSLSTDKNKYSSQVNYNFGSLPSQNEEGVYFAYDVETPKTLDVVWSIGSTDRLERISPLVRKYDLRKMALKGKHTELNLCEDGRVLPRAKNCY